MPITTAFFCSELADSTCDNSVARGVWGDSAAPAVRFRACWLDPELELALLAAVDIIGTPEIRLAGGMQPLIGTPGNYGESSIMQVAQSTPIDFKLHTVVYTIL